MQLPGAWRKKYTTEGKVYYYNTQTDQTTYDLDQVLSDVSILM